MRTIVFCLALAFTLDAAAVTVDNDSGCDIAVLPAATLLLPYFEVDLDNLNGETTLFTITNVTNVDQIAQVTLWTDRAYPVIVFPLYLTGYDVQSINLFDVIERGQIAPNAGTGTDVRPRGSYSGLNPALNLTDCDRLPGILDTVYLDRMQDAFTGGFVDAVGGVVPACSNIGGVHENAIGYATIDVVAACRPLYALDEAYWTELIRYDNVLIGDYQQLNGLENSAQGGPMVHIRAIPEGGTPEIRARLFEFDPEFDRTFYGRFQPASSPRLDGRQPLPAQFATRWIQGGVSAGSTSLKVWREGANGRDAACTTAAANGELDIREMVVFDEDENATAGLPLDRTLPATSRTSIAEAEVFPQLGNGAVGGWMYLNLDRPGDAFAAQGWVTSSMRALGRFSADTDAMALGNGCSVPARLSDVTRAFGEKIGPAPNDNGHEDDVASTQNDDTCDIAALPAATLLLPYFEVDLDNTSGATTIFTITNVTAGDQIARVTLWTDLAYPVFTFNVALTGYDVQGVSLFDVLSRGVISTTRPPRGPYSESNRNISLGACDRRPEPVLDPAIVAMLQDAFTRGVIGDCENIGGEHDNAVGYATIDLVRNCSSVTPTDDDYWTSDLAHENVLIGDYQQINLSQDAARSAEMVHIRAIPEDGDGDDAPFARTFYSRFQRAATPRADGRQPLPSTFAARWITGSVHSFFTGFEIWREATRGASASCNTYDDNFSNYVEMVAFDENENAFGMVPCTRCDPPFEPLHALPATARVASNDTSVFPQPTNGSVGGWMYMNLDADPEDEDAHQNWVVTTMSAQGRFSIAGTAAALGNGCSAPAGTSVVLSGSTVIGPAPNTNR